MTIYYEEWKEKEYTCEECSWQGNAGSCLRGLMYRKKFLELHCPSCQSMLDLIIFPEESGCGNSQENLTDAQKAAREEEEKQWKIYHGKCLQSRDQLPDLPDAEFILAWDQVEGETQIRKEDFVVWSEPVAYEAFDRFEKISLILKDKYGARVKDLIPTNRSQLLLYGDYAPAIDHVRRVRKELFGSAADVDALP